MQIAKAIVKEFNLTSDEVDHLLTLSMNERAVFINSLLCEGKLTGKQKDRLHAMIVDSKHAKRSIWQRIKRSAKVVGAKVVSVVKVVGRFAKQNWGKAAAIGLLGAAVLAAPGVVLFTSAALILLTIGMLFGMGLTVHVIQEEARRRGHNLHSVWPFQQSAAATNN